MLYLFSTYLSRWFTWLSITIESYIHSFVMAYKTFANILPIYTDGTPSQIGILSSYDGKLSMFKCNLPILEPEYATILIKVYISTGIPTRVVWTCFCWGNLGSAGNLPICFNFKVFSFVMASSNKIICCHIWMSYHFLCHNPVTLILQISNV